MQIANDRWFSAGTAQPVMPIGWMRWWGRVPIGFWGQGVLISTFWPNLLSGSIGDSPGQSYWNADWEFPALT
jgi:hypothetical protein